MAPKLLKTKQVPLQGRELRVCYYETVTLAGTRRYSVEVILGPEDRVIVDGDSVEALESRVQRWLPATIHSHRKTTDAA